ncbi:DUF4247 domain-containing protein [Streptomyces avicenniae]|uniref:DUF4247 domain-containing protein n=1 Tax=Streptomyces avicenniae TaxID=500153 RepID=UPI000699F47D|nr:DUF4247 domain-containing protein [Streptomyces avicenniae]
MSARGGRRRSGIRTAAGLLTGALLVTACGGGGDPDVPDAWIRDTYERDTTPGGGDYLDRQDTPAQVADEIERERGAMDRVTSESMVFLRYDDDIVAISPRTDVPGGSSIDVDDYESGRSRYSSHVGHYWPASQGRSGSDFRGGGPGSGK